MPTVTVDARRLYDHLGSALGLNEFDLNVFEEKLEALCFDFGLEYDGLEVEDAPDAEPRMRIEVAASRYDLLCLEGIVDALLHYLEPATHPFPDYRLVKPKDDLVTIHVGAGVHPLRPYVIGAVFRNVTFKDEKDFRSFIDLQDKLHQNLCRKRTLVAIGTHNLDVLKPPFRYDALPQKGGFEFVPLTQTKRVDGEGMFQLLENTYLKPYLYITQDSPNIPVILDSAKEVASVPPIVNGELSKMSKDTRNVFVDITACDIRKAEIVLDVITAFMSSKTAEPFTVEPVRVIYDEGHPGVPSRLGKTEYHHDLTYPSLRTDKFTVDPEYVQRLIGVPELTKSCIEALLPRMCLRAVPQDDETKLVIECPITRRDILHPCDIAEDIAIAYGYNKIVKSAHATVSLQSINNLSERLRRHIAMAGWRECLTFVLVSVDDCFANLRRSMSDKESGDEYFSINVTPALVSDPKTKEFECARTTLIPGLLKTFASNQHTMLPIKVFEVGDVVAIDRSADNKTKHRRHAAALIADTTDSLQDIHGLLDHVMTMLKVSPVYSQDGPKWNRRYRLVECSDDGAFLAERCVSIMTFEEGADGSSSKEECIGRMGVVHPETLIKYGLPLPCSIFEIAIDPFLQWLDHTDLTAP